MQACKKKYSKSFVINKIALYLVPLKLKYKKLKPHNYEKKSIINFNAWVDSTQLQCTGR